MAASFIGVIFFLTELSRASVAQRSVGEYVDVHVSRVGARGGTVGDARVPIGRKWHIFF